MDWFDEEFFQLGAFQADPQSGKILLAKGGSVKNVGEFSTSTQAQFYLKDFFSNQYLHYSPKETLLISQADLIDELTAIVSPVSFVSMSNEDKLYQSDFKNLKSQFGLGLDKVVLISREEFKANHLLPGKKKILLQALKFGAGTPYGFWNENYGIVGSTPEILYSIQGQKLKTFALAGTARRGQEEELMRSEKDRHEHNLVIQDIEEKLSKFSPEVEIGVTGILNYKEIIHLKTDLEARVAADINLGELTSKLSPTAALGGYPKSPALKFLLNSQYQQKYAERFFGSAFCVTSQDLSQCLVMIRNVQWKGHTFYIESGGGVLPESILENELEEINLKRSVIRTHYL